MQNKLIFIHAQDTPKLRGGQSSPPKSTEVMHGNPEPTAWKKPTQAVANLFIHEV